MTPPPTPASLMEEAEKTPTTYDHFKELKELFKVEAQNPCENGNTSRHDEINCPGCKTWQAAYDKVESLASIQAQTIREMVKRAIEVPTFDIGEGVTKDRFIDALKSYAKDKGIEIE